MGKLQDDLNEYFNGSTNFYDLGPMFNNIIITDGVKHFIEEGDALWAITDSLSHIITDVKLVKKGFINIRVKSNGSNGAKITIEDGNDKVLKTLTYLSSDLEEGEYNFFLIKDAVRTTLLLPGEY